MRIGIALAALAAAVVGAPAEAVVLNLRVVATVTGSVTTYLCNEGNNCPPFSRTDPFTTSVIKVQSFDLQPGSNFVEFRLGGRDVLGGQVIFENASRLTLFASDFTYFAETCGNTVRVGCTVAFGSATSIVVENTAVPEPATWLSMIAGFGMLGGALRRRRRYATHLRLQS